MADYAALADQARQSQPVDYAALAAQVRSAGTSSTPVVHGDRLKGTPSGIPDNFMGTLAKDFAALPEGAWNAATHPIDTVKGALHQLLNLPGDVVTDISQGNWGKLGAKLTELAVPALSTERGAAAAAEAGNAVKGAASATGAKVAEVAANPVARELIGVASPRLKNALAAVNRVKTAAEASAAEDAAAAPAATEAVTPGQLLARSAGQDWAKLSPEDRGMLEQVAKARQNAAAQPARPPMGPPQAPPEAAAAEPAAPVQQTTLADLIKREVQPAPVEEAPQPAIGGHDTTPAVSRGVPVRPPLRPAVAAPPEPAQVAPTVQPEPTAPPQAPPPMSMAQAEAAMMRKNPAPIDPNEVRTLYDANGERKSPQLRAAEIKGSNVLKKAARFADAFEAEGITAEDVRNMTGPERQQMTNGLIAKGRLEAGETVPNESIPNIIAELKKREKATPTAKPAAISPEAESVRANPRSADAALRDAGFTDDASGRTMKMAVERGGLTESELSDVIEMSKAIRSLDEGKPGGARHVAEAIQYRSVPMLRELANGNEFSWAEPDAPPTRIPDRILKGKVIEKGGADSAIAKRAKSVLDALKIDSPPDLSAIPADKLRTMKFSDVKALFPEGTPKAKISEAIAKAMLKATNE